MGDLFPTGEDDTRADLDLLVAWRHGDRGAGLELFERYYDSLYCFFDSKIRWDVEQLVADTMETCIRHQQALDDIESFKVFLFGAARVELYAYLEEHPRAEPTVPADPSSMSIEELAGSPATHGSDRSDLLQVALPRIPLESQLLLELYLRERFSTADLSYVMHKPARWVEAHIVTARKELEHKVTELAGDELTRADFLGTISRRFEQRAAS